MLYILLQPIRGPESFLSPSLPSPSLIHPFLSYVLCIYSLFLPCSFSFRPLNSKPVIYDKDNPTAHWDPTSKLVQGSPSHSKGGLCEHRLIKLTHGGKCSFISWILKGWLANEFMRWIWSWQNYKNPDPQRRCNKQDSFLGEWTAASLGGFRVLSHVVSIYGPIKSCYFPLICAI